MRPIEVVPARATSLVAPLVDAAGWVAGPASSDDDGDVEVALGVVHGGDPALFVHLEAKPARTLRRIVVVHEGTRADRAGMDAADEAAVASGAEIVVLHVPPSTPSAAAASLPFRIADHGTYDWAEWQEEFLRRFCRCSKGVRVSLRVVPEPAALRDLIRDVDADLVIVSGGGAVEDGKGDILGAVIGGVTPVLIVPSVGRDRATRLAAERGQRR
jgi:universal stress protein family protein